MTFTFEQPLMFALILPVIIGGIFLLREGARRPIIISRMIVLSLLVIALASPTAIVSDVTSDENPNLVVISDETASMSLFEEGVGMNVYESLTANTPTTFIRLTGESTSLGDAIEQYSTGDNQIVLVSDGNNNFGKDIDESLQYAKEMGTTVYSVAPDLEKNDISVQMLGDKTVVIGNENQFDILVSQAEEGEIRYSFEVYAGDTLIRSGTFSQETRTRTIRVPYTFKKLGAQEMRVELSPLTEDKDDINNVYYKSVYVVPKPNINLITSDTGAPLGNILYNLYDVSNSKEFTNLDNKKTVVLDNVNMRELSESDTDKLKEYVSQGNGLVLVGGEASFDRGNYLDSSFEELLPVISKPTDWKGGRSIVLVLDISQSTAAHETLSDILGNAIFILENENLRDAYAGVIAFGSEGVDVSDGLVYLGTHSNLEKLEESISSLTPGATSETSLDQGLLIAQEWLETESGELDIIIISDGGFAQSYDESLKVIEEIHEEGIDFYFIHIHEQGAPSQYDKFGNRYSEELMKSVDGTYFFIEKGERANLVFEDQEIPEEETDEIPQLTSFPLIEYNPNHFITRNIEIEGNITGYNDVTPKPGADRIIITATGKPVVTTWRYGLGRVAAITTDNGRGGQNTWASQMYSGNNSKLISSTINWAIGNPQVEEGTVVEAEDTWFGTPATLYITHYDGNTPVLRYKGDTLELAVTGKNTYETTIDPKSIGFHDVSGYPIAVNYAIEYRDVGMNEDLPVFIKANGGKTYTENEALALLLTDARGNSLKSVQRSESQKLYFLIAALLLFLGEIAVRRIREIRESKKGD
ncbi:MAG: VWA domain-containing protein [Methanococcoides sp.]|nr:VWA domain-containing protein [Methanococcoides sp.]